MSISLNQAVDMVVKGIAPDEKTQSVRVGKHDFYIRPLNGNRNLLRPDETSYFRHQHFGKDDRVFYSIKLKPKKTYDARITRIQYRGPLNSGTKKLNLQVGGLLKDLGTNGQVASKVLNFLAELKLQRLIDGEWEVEAAKIVDAIGARMAASG
ncbi:MAG: hypothetical protein KF833_02110 [Verrucomicrobiae bacterium]|nr:hypothetical protein [Verrucomicrobiae bacterium]